MWTLCVRMRLLFPVYLILQVMFRGFEFKMAARAEWPPAETEVEAIIGGDSYGIRRNN